MSDRTKTRLNITLAIITILTFLAALLTGWNTLKFQQSEHTKTLLAHQARMDEHHTRMNAMDARANLKDLRDAERAELLANRLAEVLSTLARIDERTLELQRSSRRNQP